jgi:hypothetical protein
VCEPERVGARRGRGIFQQKNICDHIVRARKMATKKRRTFVRRFFTYRSFFCSVPYPLKKADVVVFPTVIPILSFGKTFQCSIEALKIAVQHRQYKYGNSVFNLKNSTTSFR